MADEIRERLASDVATAIATVWATAERIASERSAVIVSSAQEAQRVAAVELEDAAAELTRIKTERDNVTDERDAARVAAADAERAHFEAVGRATAAEQYRDRLAQALDQANEVGTAATARAAADVHAAAERVAAAEATTRAAHERAAQTETDIRAAGAAAAAAVARARAAEVAGAGAAWRASTAISDAAFKVGRAEDRARQAEYDEGNAERSAAQTKGWLTHRAEAAEARAFDLQVQVNALRAELGAGLAEAVDGRTEPADRVPDKKLIMADQRGDQAKR